MNNPRIALYQVGLDILRVVLTHLQRLECWVFYTKVRLIRAIYGEQAREGW